MSVNCAKNMRPIGSLARVWQALFTGAVLSANRRLSLGRSNRLPGLRMFPDDSGEPAHTLCWALALYRAGQLDQASPKLRQAMLTNLYVIPHLLGREQLRLPIWPASNWDTQELSSIYRARDLGLMGCRGCALG